MNLRFYVFRHGETDWNLQKKFQGHSDIPLNAKGEAQARELTEKFKKLSPKVILSSDLKRALRTAEIVNQHLKVPVQIFKELRETHLGHAEGLTGDEIMNRFGEDLINKWRSIDPDHADYAFPGGEKKSDHLQRVQTALESYALSNTHSDRDQIAVSTHGGTLVRLIHSCCINAPETVVPIPNCVLYELEYSVVKRVWKFVGEVR